MTIDNTTPNTAEIARTAARALVDAAVEMLRNHPQLPQDVFYTELVGSVMSTHFVRADVISMVMQFIEMLADQPLTLPEIDEVDAHVLRFGQHRDTPVGRIPRTYIDYITRSTLRDLPMTIAMRSYYEAGHGLR